MDVSTLGADLLDRVIDSSVSPAGAPGQLRPAAVVSAMEELIAYGRQGLAECSFAVLAFNAISHRLFKALYSENVSDEHRKFCESVFVSPQFSAAADIAFDGKPIRLGNSKTAEAGRLGNAVVVAHLPTAQLGLIFVAWREKSFGAYSKPDLDLIGDLAHTANRLLKFAALRDHDIQTNLGAVLDCLDTALFVVDGTFTLYHVNAKASRLFDNDPGILRDGERLFFRDSGPRARIERGLDFLFAQDKAPDRAAGTVTFPLPNHNGNMLRVSMNPLPTCALTAPPLAAIMIASGERNTQIGYDQLRALGLTNAEARLAGALLEGITVAEYAKREGLAVPTVRAHLKRTMMRMGVHRQPELIRKLLSIA